jgi:hypothetical protein
MSERRGTVFLAPHADHLPAGHWVDPVTTTFWVSWQDWDEESERGELFENHDICGAEAAIAWGRERSDRVLIRLSHEKDSYFSAGVVDLTERTDGTGRPYPRWPPADGRAEAGWTPQDEAAAQAALIEAAREGLSRGDE